MKNETEFIELLSKDFFTENEKNLLEKYLAENQELKKYIKTLQQLE